MKKKLTIAQKIKSIAALLLVFLLIIVTNLINSNHFKTVQNSINTVYADRLVAMDYIYKISRELERKKMVGLSRDQAQSNKVNAQSNTSIQGLIDKYAGTKLTEKEAELFKVLQKEIEDLNSLERKPIEDGISDQKRALSTEGMDLQFSKISESLDALSEIQLAEGRRENSISNRAISTSSLMSRLEIIALIVIGLLVQMLIFYRLSSLTDLANIHLN